MKEKTGTKNTKKVPKVAKSKRVHTTKVTRHTAPDLPWYASCVCFVHKHILRKKTQKPRGFTMIELMISMAIFAIIATAGIGAYVSYMKKVHDRTTVGLMRQMDTIIASLISNKGIPPTTEQLNDYLISEGLALKSSAPISPLVHIGNTLSDIFGVPHALADTLQLKSFPGGTCADGNPCMIGYVVFFGPDGVTPMYYGVFANFRSQSTPTTESGKHTITVPGIGDITAHFISNHPAITPTLSDDDGRINIMLLPPVTTITPTFSLAPLTPIEIPTPTITDPYTDAITTLWETTWENSSSDSYASCSAYNGDPWGCANDASCEWDYSSNYYCVASGSITTTYCYSQAWDYGYDQWGNWLYDCVDNLITPTTTWYDVPSTSWQPYGPVQCSDTFAECYQSGYGTYSGIAANYGDYSWYCEDQSYQNPPMQCFLIAPSNT